MLFTEVSFINHIEICDILDTETNILIEEQDLFSEGCVRKSDDSWGSAIRIAYRISLRSSSLWEPRHPSLKVIMVFVIAAVLPSKSVEKQFIIFRSLAMEASCCFVVYKFAENNDRNSMPQHAISSAEILRFWGVHGVDMDYSDRMILPQVHLR